VRFSNKIPEVTIKNKVAKKIKKHAFNRMKRARSPTELILSSVEKSS